MNYSISNDYRILISGLELANINGANTTYKPTTGIAAGFYATITIFYV